MRCCHCRLASLWFLAELLLLAASLLLLYLLLKVPLIESLTGSSTSLLILAPLVLPAFLLLLTVPAAAGALEVVASVTVQRGLIYTKHKP